MAKYMYREKNLVIVLEPILITDENSLKWFIEKHNRTPESDQEWEEWQAQVDIQLVAYQAKNN